jgi:mRNA-degrading endonuclease YafQ of YafQ-DinJ toxin-antitoxin module
MIRVVYTKKFIRQYSKLPPALQNAVKEKITEFSVRNHHKKLKVHKLKGKLKNYYGFSVDYSNRIVFMWDDKNTVALLDVGNHDIYK